MSCHIIDAGDCYIVRCEKLYPALCGVTTLLENIKYMPSDCTEDDLQCVNALLENVFKPYLELPSNGPILNSVIKLFKTLPLTQLKNLYHFLSIKMCRNNLVSRNKVLSYKDIWTKCRVGITAACCDLCETSGAGVFMLILYIAQRPTYGDDGENFY